MKCPNCDGRGLHEVNFDAHECKPCGGSGDMVEEDGEYLFTPMPKVCHGWAFAHKSAPVVEMNGFMRCERCMVSYGPAPTVNGDPCR